MNNIDIEVMKAHARQYISAEAYEKVMKKMGNWSYSHLNPVKHGISRSYKKFWEMSQKENTKQKTVEINKQTKKVNKEKRRNELIQKMIDNLFLDEDQPEIFTELDRIELDKLNQELF